MNKKMKTLGYYIDCFSRLNCNKWHGEVAPHKAVMLIAVMEEVAAGRVTNGFVPHNDRMVRAFERVWRRCVSERSVWNPTFATPFFHLGGELFWKLMRSDRYHKHREYSIGKLRESFFGAKIDDELAAMMEDDYCRHRLTLALIERYLPHFGRWTLMDMPMVAEERADRASGGDPAPEASSRLSA